MEILYNFGFEPMLFLAQIVNFLVIFFVLQKFLYKPMLSMLEKRKSTISQGLQDAEQSQKLLEETMTKQEKMLRDAETQSRKMIEEAKSERTTLLEHAKVQTKKQVDTMLKEAREQISYETKIAEKNLETHVSHLAISFLEKSLPHLLDKSDQTKIMDNAKKRLEKLKGRID